MFLWSSFKLRKEETFIWQPEHHVIFDKMKEYLANLLVLMPFMLHYPFILYILAANGYIGSLLVQENSNGFKQAVYYLSRILI